MKIISVGETLVRNNVTEMKKFEVNVMNIKFLIDVEVERKWEEEGDTEMLNRALEKVVKSFVKFSKEKDIRCAFQLWEDTEEIQLEVQEVNE
jgi:hypothetical protein